MWGGVPPGHGGNLRARRPPRGNWVRGSTEPGHSRPTACLISGLLRATFHSQWLAAHPAVEMDMSNGLQLVSAPYSHHHPDPNTYAYSPQGGLATDKSWRGNRASCAVLPLTLTSIKWGQASGRGRLSSPALDRNSKWWDDLQLAGHSMNIISPLTEKYCKLHSDLKWSLF